MDRQKIALLFGGESPEHEVSLRSAASIYEALQQLPFDTQLIWIDKEGQWHLVDAIYGPTIKINITATLIDHLKQFNSVFPVLHGPFGEDGTVQGLLRMVKVPFVGADVMSTAICMDKEISKRLLLQAGVRVAKFLCIKHQRYDLDYIEREIGFPCFVKPANMGSSIGVTRVFSPSSLEEAIKSAFEYDCKVLIEKEVVGDEVECSVLGNENPICSLPARFFPTHEFYTYEAKYIDLEGARFENPALYPIEWIRKIQKTVLTVYDTLDCRGMARVDMFVTKEGEVIVNEVNTLPGFTSISLYPQMWEVSGLPFTELIRQLINLSIEEFEKRSHLNKAICSANKTAITEQTSGISL